MKRSIFSGLFFTACFFFASSQITLSKDINFGNNGVVEIENPNYYIKINDTESYKSYLFKDDKILINYCSTDINNPVTKYIRLNSDGSTDTTFGINGIISNSEYQDTYFYADSNSFYTKSGKKFFNNGQLDISYGVSGFLNTGATPYKVINSDNKLLARQDDKITRYLASGAIDNSFGTNGIMLLDQTINASSSANDVDLVHHTNQYFTENVWSVGINARLRKINISTGNLDASYGNSGYAEISSVNGSAGFNFYSGSALDLQNDYYINKFDDLDGNFRLTKTNSNGFLDGSFGNNGMLEINNMFSYGGRDYLGGERKPVLFQNYILISTEGYDTSAFVGLRAFQHDGTPVTINTDAFYPLQGVSYSVSPEEMKIIVKGNYLYVFYDNKIARYIFNGTSLSVNDSNHKEIFEVINPFKEELIINTNAKIREIKLLDIDGRVVLKSKRKILDTSHLKKGTYIVNLLTESGEVFVSKSIKL